jgi:ribose 5-phosphate isomerase B
MEKILIGSDQWGLPLKKELKAYLETKDLEVVDLGSEEGQPPIPYYTISATAARMIQRGEAKRAVLCCGTGMGMAIVANKFRGVYAAVIESEFAAQKSKTVNNANVLAMGYEMISFPKAKMALDRWLTLSHTEGLEEIGDFLKLGLAEIEKIEAENFKA